MSIFQEMHPLDKMAFNKSVRDEMRAFDYKPLHPYRWKEVFARHARDSHNRAADKVYEKQIDGYPVSKEEIKSAERHEKAANRLDAARHRYRMKNAERIQNNFKNGISEGQIMNDKEFEALLEEAFEMGYEDADSEICNEEAHMRHIRRQFSKGGEYGKKNKFHKTIEVTNHKLKKLANKGVETDSWFHSDPRVGKIWDDFYKKKRYVDNPNNTGYYDKMNKAYNKGFKSLKEKILWNADRAQYTNNSNDSIRERIKKYYHKK